MRPIERKIYFLRVESPTDFADTLAEINAQDDTWLYMRTDEYGGGVYLHSLEDTADMCKGIISKVRMENLPSVATAGRRDVTQALLIAEDQGLAESTHFMYFKSSKLLAFEYNHFGPRSTALRAYVISKADALHGEPLKLTFQDILDENTLQLLGDGNEIRLLKVAVPKARIGALASQDQSIYEAFENASHFAEGGEIEIVMRMTTNRNAPDAANIRQGILAKARRLAEMPTEVFSKLEARIKPQNGRLLTANLLENRFVVTVQVLPNGRTNVLNSEQLFTGMQSAYQENRELLSKLSEYESLN